MLSRRDLYTTHETILGGIGVSAPMPGPGITGGVTTSNGEYNPVEYGDVLSNATPLSIRQAIRLLEDLDEKRALFTIKRYPGGDAVAELLADGGFLEPRRLAGLLLWLEEQLGTRVRELEAVVDPETGELAFIGIHLEGCGWEEWRVLAKSVKKALREEGFVDLARRVVLVCTEALEGLRG